MKQITTLLFIISAPFALAQETPERKEHSAKLLALDYLLNLATSIQYYRDKGSQTLIDEY